ncbi:uncharacterized protein EV420DRAFT_1574830 [Desarmillaria tabescens]|uniref:HMG box domain-containing protein n=1 Tax=Armillaria tabescens TaxID=1929756 RepID=A0AA39JMT7_ARMTA|nr:uncharacterized protein EV420DRAFT_1574830 [Desarmillaria tabescens]KAK0444219.1 hypothetical protein EV420DRAFT_1574830 [Desarmillaria tabescens]
MLSALRARLGAKLPAFSRLAAFTRQSTVSSVARPIICTQRLPAKKTTVTKSTATKTKAKAGAAKKKPAKKPAAKKVAAKKKAAKPGPKPKKKVVKPKVVKFKITPDMKPPKRSLTPYMTFHTQRVHASEKLTNLAEAQAAVKSSAAVWKTLSDAQKQPYVDLAAEARKEYEKTMEALELNKRRVAKGKAKISKPDWMEKEPSSAYMRFATEFKEGKDIPYVEALKQAKVAWANMPETKKQELKAVAQKEISAFRAKQHATV